MKGKGRWELIHKRCHYLWIITLTPSFANLKRKWYKLASQRKHWQSLFIYIKENSISSSPLNSPNFDELKMRGLIGMIDTLQISRIPSLSFFVKHPHKVHDTTPFSLFLFTIFSSLSIQTNSQWTWNIYCIWNTQFIETQTHAYTQSSMTY